MLHHHFARRHSPARRPPIVSTTHVGSRHLFRQVLFTLFLCLLLFPSLLGNWASPLPYALASGHPRPTPVPGNLTLQKFLREGHPDHGHHGAFRFPLNPRNRRWTRAFTPWTWPTCRPAPNPLS